MTQREETIQALKYELSAHAAELAALTMPPQTREEVLAKYATSDGAPVDYLMLKMRLESALMHTAQQYAELLKKQTYSPLTSLDDKRIRVHACAYHLMQAIDNVAKDNNSATLSERITCVVDMEYRLMQAALEYKEALVEYHNRTYV